MPQPRKTIDRAGDLIVALPKGKLLQPAFAWLENAGYTFAESDVQSRKLMFSAEQGNMSAILVKPTDVPIYVEYGIADIGIAGTDTLQESGADVFEPLDLGFGQCRIVVAGWPEDAQCDFRKRSVIRVGTKYPNIARAHFDERGVQVEMIAVQGSVELSVLTGLADVIVDIVETGNTLRENGLVVHEEIMPSSARLIVNKASHKLKLSAIDNLLRQSESASK